MGVIGYELGFGKHPWLFSEHPFLPDRPDVEAQRMRYFGKYTEADRKLVAAEPVGPSQLDCT